MCSGLRGGRHGAMGGRKYHGPADNDGWTEKFRKEMYNQLFGGKSRGKGGGDGQKGLQWKCFTHDCGHQNDGLQPCSKCKRPAPGHIWDRVDKQSKNRTIGKGGGKVGKDDLSSTASAPAAGGGGGKAPKGTGKGGGGSAAPADDKDKELAVLRAKVAKLEAGATGQPKNDGDKEPDANEESKLAMDKLRQEIETLRRVEGDDAKALIQSREKELEALRLKVRQGHPVDIQIRNLDHKLENVQRQREKHDERSKDLAKQIRELQKQLVEEADGAAGKKREEEQLRRERCQLVQRQGQEQLAKAKVAAGDEPAEKDAPIDLVVHGLKLDEMCRQLGGNESLKEELRVAIEVLAKAARTGSAMEIPSGPANEPAPTKPKEGDKAVGPESGTAGASTAAAGKEVADAVQAAKLALETPVRDNNEGMEVENEPPGAGAAGTSG